MLLLNTHQKGSMLTIFPPFSFLFPPLSSLFSSSFPSPIPHPVLILCLSFSLSIVSRRADQFLLITLNWFHVQSYAITWVKSVFLSPAVCLLHDSQQNNERFGTSTHCLWYKRHIKGSQDKPRVTSQMVQGGCSSQGEVPSQPSPGTSWPCLCSGSEQPSTPQQSL